MLTNKLDLLRCQSFWARSATELRSNEEDVIIISTVWSSKSAYIGPFSDPKVVSFCLTRARKCLWIVGSGHALKGSHFLWNEIVHDAEERSRFINSAEDNFLSKTILNVKDELKHIDDVIQLESSYFIGKKWKVLYSDDFKKSFIGLQCTLTKKIIIGYLWRLSCGWRPKRKSLYLSRFVKEFRVHGLTLICTYDIEKESEYFQVMKVWDVLTLLEAPKLLGCLECMKSYFHSTFVQCCMVDKNDGDLLVPFSWKSCPYRLMYKDSVLDGYGTHSKSKSFLDLIRTNRDREELMLMKFYALSSGTTNNLLTACDGHEIELPFEVSNTEAKIIKFPKSAFILGRSGTGKSCVLVTKLVQREQEYSIAMNGISSQFSSSSNQSQIYERSHIPEDSDGLRQVYLTVSPVLCASVKDYIRQLGRYAAGSQAPLKLNVIKKHDACGSISNSDIPNSFNDMSKCHFPLAISLQKFLIMLDGSMKCSFFENFSDLRKIIGGKGRSPMSSVLQNVITHKEVDFDRFLSSYWPRLDENLTKKLDPSLVFFEIIFCIKGGLGATETAIYNNNMSKKDYSSLNRKQQSVSIDVRMLIYDIFLKYEKHKCRNDEYDISDLVNHLITCLSTCGYQGPKMDFIYIDEVQDLTMKQIFLVKYICTNLQDGLVFAGDTAQTLAGEFRFGDLNLLFYKEFLMGSGCVPQQFTLTTNFRTHLGILSLAESILDLIYHFFSSSVDRVASEMSVARGELPVLLKSVHGSEVLDTIFGNPCSIGFGADQVILVRDVCTKDEVIRKIGNRGMVLTIKECKGLEFKDVLLFNFFRDSPMKNQWRLVYNFEDHKNLSNSLSPESYPWFDPDKHRTFCSELKHLYVAVTRTKERLWISETSSEFSRPIFDYWKKLDLVKEEILDSSFLTKMQVHYIKEEWETRGTKFFNDGKYDMAMKCFKKSGNVYMENWANAASHEADARHTIHTNFDLALNSLTRAADIYESIGKMKLAATCYIKLGKFKTAGMIYLHKFCEPMFEDAGDCFALGGLWSKAAEVYAKGLFLSKCLSACREGLNFDLGCHFLKEWPTKVSAVEWTDYLGSCVEEYHKLQDPGSLKKFVWSLDSLPKDVIDLLLKSENFDAAIAVARLKGEVILEANILYRAEQYEKSSSLMIFYAVGQLIWNEMEGWALKPLDRQNKILEKARSTAMRVSNDFESRISAEADFLSDNFASVPSLGMHMKNASIHQNICIEVISSRQILEICFHTNVFGFHQETDMSLTRYYGQSVEGMLQEGYVSVQILMFCWNLWEKNARGVLQYFHSIGTPEVSKYTRFEVFCMKYFGVLKLNLKGFFVSSNIAASWNKLKDGRHDNVIDNFTYMRDSVFYSLAQKYWESEVISVGTMLLRKLEELHSHLSTRKNYVVQQGILVHHFVRVLNCVKEHGYSVKKIPSELLESIKGSNTILFPTFFPLDQDVSTTLGETTSSMQANTALAATIVDKNLDIRFGKFDPAKIARFMVFCLSRKLGGMLCRAISSRLNLDISWHRFLQNLIDFKKSKWCHTSQLDKALVALSDFDIRSQVLLLENILIYATSCELGKGCFIVSKYSLSSFLSSKESTAYFDAFSASTSQSLRNIHESYTPIYDIILRIASKTMSLWGVLWTNKRMANVAKDYQFLLLRIVILVCVVCLNSAKQLPKVNEMLKEAYSLLPALPRHFLAKFWNAKSGRIRSLKCFGAVLARSMESVGDQLVVVRLDDFDKPFDHLQPLYLKHSLFCQGKAYTQILLEKKKQL